MVEKSVLDAFTAIVVAEQMRRRALCAYVAQRGVTSGRNFYKGKTENFCARFTQHCSFSQSTRHFTAGGYYAWMPLAVIWNVTTEKRLAHLEDKKLRHLRGGYDRRVAALRRYQLLAGERLIVFPKLDCPIRRSTARDHCTWLRVYG